MHLVLLLSLVPLTLAMPIAKPFAEPQRGGGHGGGGNRGGGNWGGGPWGGGNWGGEGWNRGGGGGEGRDWEGFWNAAEGIWNGLTGLAAGASSPPAPIPAAVPVPYPAPKPYNPPYNQNPGNRDQPPDVVVVVPEVVIVDQNGNPIPNGSWSKTAARPVAVQEGEAKPDSTSVDPETVVKPSAAPEKPALSTPWSNSTSPVARGRVRGLA